MLGNWFQNTNQISPKSPESRSVSGDFDRVVQSFLAQYKTGSGQQVTCDTAMRSAAVSACVRVLAETFASLPAALYRNKNGVKKVVTDHDLYDLLHNSPHPVLTSYEFKEMGMGHMALRGNFYNYIERSYGGAILSLTPLVPQNVTIELSKSGKLKQYRYTTVDGTEETFSDAEVWHVKNLSLDGLEGLSPVGVCRESIGLALAADDFASRYYANNAQPGGILNSPGVMDDDAQKRLISGVQRASSGENRFKLLVLEQGVTWQQVGLSQVDSQFLETRQFQIEEIARIFRVPAILIGHANNTSTYASAEQFMLSFVTYTMRPWCVRWEQSINKFLLSEKDRKKGYHIEFNLDAIVRGDLLTRFRAYSLGISSRVVCPNECRVHESLPPYDEGNEFFNPAITPAGSNTNDLNSNDNSVNGDNNNA